MSTTTYTAIAAFDLRRLSAGLVGSSMFMLLPGAVEATLVGDASTQWQALPGNYDYLKDQQTGDPSSDIVGDLSNPGFFTTFNSDDPTNNTDGTLGFRVRLDAQGGNPNSPSLDRVVWVGIDADVNGSLDVFIGANYHGSTEELSIRDSGTDLNTSPSTSSVSSSPAYTYTPGALNYDYRLVNHLLDGGTLDDVTTNTTGDPDYYVSFFMPLQDIATFLLTQGITVTDSTPLRYVLATSAQPNSLNQDLGGIQGSVNSSDTWVGLGGFTPVMTAAGTVVPEPSPAILVLTAGLVPLLRRRR